MFVNILTFLSLRQQTELRLLFGCRRQQTEGLAERYVVRVHCEHQTHCKYHLAVSTVPVVDEIKEGSSRSGVAYPATPLQSAAQVGGEEGGTGGIVLPKILLPSC